ncbi:MAG: FGGY family carbohydrate kinase [Actinobacteria bacterium]|nr:FGGY family carbohydrate kinase [Actinomycetota bacterium]
MKNSNKIEYLIGCDIGTSSTKVELVSIKGEIISSEQVYYATIRSKNGRVEQKAGVYVNALSTCIKDVINKNDININKILAMGLSSHCPTFLPVDKVLDPLGNVILYSDSRSRSECEWIAKSIGEDKIIDVSGNSIQPYYSFTKALWFKNNYSELYLKTYKFLNVKDYFIYLLTGQIATDYSSAALNGIVFDIRKKIWDDNILSQISINKNKLPQILPGDKIIGYITNNGSKLFGLRKKMPVILGTVDACASYLSMGVTNSSECALQIGSTATFGIIFEIQEFLKDLVNCPYIVDPENKYLSMGSIFCGGTLLSWLKNIFFKNSKSENNDKKLFEMMEREALDIPIGSNGLVMFPFLVREGPPFWDQFSKGAMFGLSLHHDRGSLIKSAMESVGLGIYHTVNLLKNNKINIESPIFLVGGGFKRELWRKIIVNIIGIESAYFPSIQDAPFADAFLAGKAIGVFNDYSEIKKWIKEPEVINVNKSEHEKYNKLYKFWIELYKFLKDKYKEFDELMNDLNNN